MSAFTSSPFFIALSPNERDAIIAQQKEQRKRSRLLQVRQQTSTLAATTRTKFKTSAVSEYATLESQLKQDFQSCQSKKIAVLQKGKEKNEKAVGDAHVLARISRLEKIHQVDKLQETLPVTQDKENVRFTTALQQLAKPPTPREIREQEYRELRDKIMESERYRAAAIGRILRERRTHVIDIEVQSNPLQATNKDMFNRRRTTTAIQYDSTQHHKNYSVVRCAPDVKSTGVAIRTAYSAAIQAAKELEMEKMQKVELERKYQEKTKKRFGVAVRKIELAKEKETMRESLEKLSGEDRKRRQKNMSTREETERYYRPSDYQEMEAAFQDMFSIKKDGGNGSGSKNKGKGRK